MKLALHYLHASMLYTVTFTDTKHQITQETQITQEMISYILIIYNSFHYVFFFFCKITSES